MLKIKKTWVHGKKEGYELHVYSQNEKKKK